MLYPRSKVVLASSTKFQARLLITQYVLGQLYNSSKAIRDAINFKDSKTSINDTYVLFKNGSSIIVATSGESSRGLRASVIVSEESAKMMLDFIRDIMTKFLQNGDRKARYLENPKYTGYKSKHETKKSIYISSGWLTTNWLYDLSMAAYEEMLKRGRQVVLSFNWTFPVISGFMDYEEDIKPAMDSPDWSKLHWAMENEGLFSSVSESAIYGHDDLVKCRCIPPNKILRSIPHECYLDDSLMKEWKKKYYIPKDKDEIRILSVDIALRGGNNDNTVMSLISAKKNKNGDRYTKQLLFMEHHNDAHSEAQSIRFKQLYEDFDVDLVCLDINGNGNAVFLAGTKWQEDKSRNKKYPPFTVFNVEDLKDKIWDANIEDARACIFAVTQNSKYNHDMIMWLKADIENMRLELPDTSTKAEDWYVEEKETNKFNVDETKMKRDLSTHYETDVLIKEMTSLEIQNQPNQPYIKVVNETERKDRFSSLGFAVHYITNKEQDLVRRKRKKRSGIMSLLN